MAGIRILLPLLLLTPLLAAGGGESKTVPPKEPPKAKQALNKVFRGKVVKIKKNQVTIYYDFEDPEQLKDFEDARPPRLLDASANKVSIEGGRLVLQGSSSIRHKMEGKGKLRAHFYVRPGKQWNIGTVFTEPVLSDFYVVCNLFDGLFYGNGAFYLGACGLHEDEGAEDLSTGKVNFRDIFSADLKKKAPVGEDVEMEVWKDGYTEYCRVADVEGKGSSKGKSKGVWDTYQFGFFVHQSRATFDDLTLVVELTDQFLDLNSLRADIDVEWEDTPATGPLAGIGGVSPRVRAEVDAYAEGKGENRAVIRAMLSPGLPMEAREVVLKLLLDRKDPKAVPLLVEGLYAEDKVSRRLAIDAIKSIVGTTFGYSATASEKERSKALQKLNAHLDENRALYYG
ncbi:MAG: hypothetical protein ACHQ1G_00825 [Planctomycetota bacterium]